MTGQAQGSHKEEAGEAGRDVALRATEVGPGREYEPGNAGHLRSGEKPRNSVPTVTSKTQPRGPIRTPQSTAGRDWACVASSH